MHFEFNTKKIRQNVLCLLMFIFLIIVIHILLQAGLSCTDSKGCLRSWCKIELLNAEYSVFVQDQSKLCNNN